MSKKLLLADDSVTIQKVVELLLSDENFEIKSVNNGEEAWSIIKEYNPDIVLADIEMPNMNGYQLCEKIKNDEALSHIPVILLAGAFEPLDEELAKDVRADDYLVKPFESQELISKLNAVLASKEIEEAVATTKEPETPEEAEVITEHIEDETLEAEAVEVAAPLEEMDISEEELMSETAEEAGFTEEEISPVEDVAGETESPDEISVTEEATIIEEEQPAIAEEEGEETASMEPVETSAEESVLEEVIPSQPSAEIEIEAPSSEEILHIIENKVEDKVAGIFKDISFSAVEDNLRERVNQKVEELVGSSDINGAIERALEETLKTSIERLAEETISRIIEETVKTTIEEISDSLKQQVEKIIWETVPDLAETIITKEIEKIKATF